MTHAIVSRLDRLQRRHRALGFSYAVMRKYADDAGGREAAVITYYGFLSIFPILLLAVTIVSWMLAESPDLRQRLVDAMLPPSFQPSVAHAAAALPRSPAALAAGVVGLLYTATGVVLSAYRTLNHIAAVPLRRRAGLLSRAVRVLAVVLVLLLGTVGVGACTVAAAALPGLGDGMYLLSQVLVSVAQIAAVRYGGLWPRALDGSRPTDADARAVALVVREVAPPDASRPPCAEEAGSARSGRP